MVITMRKERIIFHIDVNNAFLSWSAVKLLKEGYKIDIRRIPSVIGGDESKRHGIVLAKSPVAKKYGIRTAETLYSARKKCRGLKIYPPDHECYHQMSNAFFNYLRKYSPDMEQISIDECFLDMSNTNFLYDDLEQLAFNIKDEIKQKFGFTVNIGIGNNKLCAKMAGDFEKPDKVHTLYMGEVETKMWPLPVNQLYMVGKKTSEVLRNLGIDTIGKLAKTDVSLLRKYFKNQSITMWESANGIDDSKVISEDYDNKCISVSETFEVDVDDIDRLKKVLLKQTEQVSKTLRKQESYTNTVALTFKTYDFKSFSRQTKVKNPTDITSELYKYVIHLLDRYWDGTKIRSIGVRLSNFVKERETQLSLFEEYNEKDEKIEKIIDNIKDKYGNNSVIKASLLKKDESLGGRYE